MPSKRKYSGKKRSLSKRLSKLERTSRPEVKVRTDESSGFENVGSIVGTLIRPQQLAQLTTRAGRIGDKVKTRNISFRGILKMPNASANCTCAVRVLVLYSKVQDPSTSDMPDWYASVDVDKFFVLRDFLTQVSIVSQDSNDVTCGSTLKKIKFNIPTRYRKLQFDGAGQISPLNNEVVIYMLAENNAAEIAYNWQHYYIDN